MTIERLAACPSCARHVRTDEPRCPFCEAALPPSFRSTPVVEAPSVRLGRAALYAVGVGAISLSSAQGCGSHTTSLPAYGGPPADASPREDAPARDTGTGGDDGGATSDGSPSPDARSFPEASSPEASSLDGAPDAVIDVGGVPVYGAPPPRGPGMDDRCHPGPVVRWWEKGHGHAAP